MANGIKCPHCNGTGSLVGEGLHPGALIMTFRKARDMTQLELAQKAGLSRGQVANLEVGRTDLPVKTLQRIAVALGVPTKELIP